ncbi:MAG: hypothetical protein AAF587_33830 [Bacteroidota bacterium]
MDKEETLEQKKFLDDLSESMRPDQFGFGVDLLQIRADSELIHKKKVEHFFRNPSDLTLMRFFKSIHPEHRQMFLWNAHSIYSMILDKKVRSSLQQFIGINYGVMIPVCKDHTVQERKREYSLVKQTCYPFKFSSNGDLLAHYNIYTEIAPLKECNIYEIYWGFMKEGTWDAELEKLFYYYFIKTLMEALNPQERNVVLAYLNGAKKMADAAKSAKMEFEAFRHVQTELKKKITNPEAPIEPIMKGKTHFKTFTAFLKNIISEHQIDISDFHKQYR